MPRLLSGQKVEHDMSKVLKNVIRGAGSVVNISPKTASKGRVYAILKQSNNTALRRDWERVGKDLQHAFSQEVNGKKA